MTTLRILTPEEIKIFNSVSILNFNEQRYYFTIPNNLLESIESSINQIHFIALFDLMKKTGA